MRRQRDRREGPPPVLIISASMGAGHDGAARSLAAQLRAAGTPAEVRDFLRSGPLGIGSALRAGYEFELRHVPSAYDATYRFWYRVPWLCPLIAGVVTLLTGRRVLRWVEEAGPTAVVSTYPLATLCLGRLRRTGRLRVPVVNFITDFGVHPLWVHRGADLNLAIHDEPARVARSRTAKPSVACGPAVAEAFTPGTAAARDEARSRWGLGPGDRAVLVVAGSWGVGNLTATWEAVAGAGRFVPVVVCGRDDALRQQLSARADAEGTRSVIVGWTDEMPSLMAACDALVENAGGLTSLEAMRAGLPVVSFDPIAGHGRENTSAMHAAGVARLAPDRAALVAALDDLTVPSAARAAQVAEGLRLFRDRPANLVLDAAARALPAPDRRRRPAVALRAAVMAGAVGGAGWAGLTTGVAMATEAGAGVARPAAGSSAAYVGVRLSADEVTDGAVIARLRAMRVTAVVDQATADAVPVAVKALSSDGLTVADGGFGEGPGMTQADASPWRRAWLDARAGGRISGLTGTRVTVSVPGRRLNAWDLIECRNAHLELVVPNHLLHPGAMEEARSLRITAGSVYLVNGLGVTPHELAEYMASLQSELELSGTASSPLASLG